MKTGDRVAVHVRGKRKVLKRVEWIGTVVTGGTEWAKVLDSAGTTWMILVDRLEVI